ncbi:HD-GYP domain-containing protein [Candidatus Formimonas warabiya]|uniref:HD-GYP domain-containing protein n=1 Tax=Formimonas warabiya TaxID=1761012 RepID=A0A3G1KMG1_FORW1|nr:HD domain-containing phosphohydrolase [Candidatus Formimonas warabiya]ATW23666.1 hypothetical protein DCMF_01625 [Candidatus Formimonas warabiya]
MSSFLPKLLIFLNISFLVIVLECLLGVIFLGFLICLFLLVRQKRKAAREEKRFHAVEQLLHNLQPGESLDESLYRLLGLFIPVVKGQGYYFYISNDHKEYELKARRYADDDQVPIQERLAALEPFSHMISEPPAPVSLASLECRIFKQGEAPFMEIPVKGAKGLIRIGPVLSGEKQDFAFLHYLADQIEPVLEALVQMDQAKKQVAVTESSRKAVKAVTDAAMNFPGTVNTILGLCIRMITASGGCLLSSREQEIDGVTVLGMENELKNLFRQDQSALKTLTHILGDRDFIVLDGEHPEFFQIPSYFSAAGMVKIFLIKVPRMDEKGLAVFWFHDPIHIEQHRIYGLQMVLSRLGDTLDSYQVYQEQSKSYLEVLKVLVNTIDNCDPYQAGYAELMSRYAGIMAKEMNLEDQEVRDIVLAAYLSNIGKIGMSLDLFLKEGKYAEVEYEQMKLHCEIGAAIVEVVFGNNHVASYIRHHHERMDGCGYPAGLKGEEIPLGARVLAVAQFFIAKTMGRNYREPLNFEQAMKLVKDAAGSLLDPEVVGFLLNWFSKKQANPQRAGRSLGPCWEMRCAPVSICSQCPAYQHTDKNCWDYENVNCLAHGNSCSSCFVCAEYVYRTQNPAPKAAGDIVNVFVAAD